MYYTAMVDHSSTRSRALCNAEGNFAVLELHQAGKAARIACRARPETRTVAMKERLHKDSKKNSEAQFSTRSAPPR
jgi:hypothetical protein